MYIRSRSSKYPFACSGGDNWQLSSRFLPNLAKIKLCKPVTLNCSMKNSNKKKQECKLVNMFIPFIEIIPSVEPSSVFSYLKHPYIHHLIKFSVFWQHSSYNYLSYTTVQKVNANREVLRDICEVLNHLKTGWIQGNMKHWVKKMTIWAIKVCKPCYLVNILINRETSGTVNYSQHVGLDIYAQCL